MQVPAFKDLPNGSSWGLWDVDGEKDEYGTLNHLSPATKLRAAQEIRAGISISLNWELNKPVTPVFHRTSLQHTVVDNSTFSTSASFDDVLEFNTQSSSQWDGLRHVVHAGTGRLYNGCTKDEIVNSNRLGIHVWHKRGGIVGRGVLIDYVAYAARHHISYSPTTPHAITLDALKQAASEQDLIFEPGDILIVRTGLIKWYNETIDPALRKKYFTDPNKGCVGVAPNMDTIEWVWNQHFAAVAGDSLAWEPIPYPKETPSFHQYLLALWGLPIGELWDLEVLAATCANLGRYSFFFTSIPLNVPGGVASPPNALAIL